MIEIKEELLHELGYDGLEIKVEVENNLTFKNIILNNFFKKSLEYNLDLIFPKIKIIFLTKELETYKNTKMLEAFITYFPSREKLNKFKLYNSYSQLTAFLHNKEIENLLTEIISKDGNFNEKIIRKEENMLFIDKIKLDNNFLQLKLDLYLLENLKTILELTLNLNIDKLIINSDIFEIKEENIESNKKYLKQKKIFFMNLDFKQIKKSKFYINF